MVRVEGMDLEVAVALAMALVAGWAESHNATCRSLKSQNRSFGWCPKILRKDSSGDRQPSSRGRQPGTSNRREAVALVAAVTLLVASVPTLSKEMAAAAEAAAVVSTGGEAPRQETCWMVIPVGEARAKTAAAAACWVNWRPHQVRLVARSAGRPFGAVRCRPIRALRQNHKRSRQLRLRLGRFWHSELWTQRQS